MRLRYIYFILLVMIMAACQAPRTMIPASVLPSSDKTIVTNSTPTSIIFTQIPEGLDTPVSPTKVPTYTTQPPKPTVSSQEIAGSILKELNIDKEWKPSPNGMCTWERLTGFTNTDAASVKYNNQIFEYVTVTCGPEPQKMVLIDEWTEGGLGYSIPALLGWSVDEKYLYFDDAVIPDGCQPLGGYQKDLRRVNLANGDILSYPIKLVEVMTLSPKSDLVVYSDPQTSEVGIYDLNNSTERRMPIKLPSTLEYWEAGNFTWSQDEQKVVFIVQYGDPCSPTMYSVRLIDIANNQIITLLEKENQVVSIVEWKETNHVLISIEGKQFWLDPNTGGIVLAPECPDNCVTIPQ